MAASWRPLLQREDDDTSEGVFCFSLPLFDSRSARVFFSCSSRVANGRFTCLFRSSNFLRKPPSQKAIRSDEVNGGKTWQPLVKEIPTKKFKRTFRGRKKNGKQNKQNNRAVFSSLIPAFNVVSGFFLVRHCLLEFGHKVTVRVVAFPSFFLSSSETSNSFERRFLPSSPRGVSVIYFRRFFARLWR